MCHNNEVVRSVARQFRPVADRQTELISAGALPAALAMRAAIVP